MRKIIVREDLSQSRVCYLLVVDDLHRVEEVIQLEVMCVIMTLDISTPRLFAYCH